MEAAFARRSLAGALDAQKPEASKTYMNLTWRGMVGIGLTAFVAVGASGDKWRGVAKSHADFAAALAADDVRFDAAFRTWAATIVDFDCQPRADKVRGLAAAEVRRVTLFAEYLCRLWLKTWDKAIGPCDRDHTPKWCLDENALAARIDLEPYFSTLTDALRNATDKKVRLNTMFLIANSATPHVITEYPRNLVDRWLATAASEFLKSADPDDAIEVVRSIRDTWIGVGPGVSREFLAYADRPDGPTEDQRRQLVEIASKRYGQADKQ